MDLFSDNFSNLLLECDAHMLQEPNVHGANEVTFTTHDFMVLAPGTSSAVAEAVSTEAFPCATLANTWQGPWEDSPFGEAHPNLRIKPRRKAMYSLLNPIK
jgi:hypothetical protein